MAGLFPLSRQQQLDSEGTPLAGARLFLFDGGTTTPRTGYRDLALSSAHPNPILADSAGRFPLIYLADGYYRQRLTTSTGGLVFDDDGLPVLSTSAGGAGTSVDPDSVFKTRDIKIRFDDSQIDGYVRLNGKSIGSALSGATERANADAQSLYEELWGFDNIVVAAGKGASAAADFAANKPLTLPNFQGASIFGLPDMGNTADTAFAALLTGTDTSGPGATGGADTVAIEKANIPSYNLTSGSVTSQGATGVESVAHTHTFSGTTSVESATHTHSIDGDFSQVQGGTGVTALVVGGNRASGIDGADHTHTYSGETSGASASHTHNVTSTSTSLSIASGGSGAAVNKLPSLVTLMIYIRL